MKNPNKNRSMDHNNLSFKAILMKYRCPFVPSLFQKRPSCFPKRCLLLDSQRVNENARVIRRSLPMSLFGPCPTSSGQIIFNCRYRLGYQARILGLLFLWVVLTESQIFAQRKTNFKNKKDTILTMIIFYPSHVFTSHFVAQCKSFMEPKLGYFYEYNILYA